MDNKLLGGKAGNEGIPMDLTQQMLLASQLGIPPAMLDPSLSSGMMNSPQGALALQQQMVGLQALGAFNPPFSFGTGANALPHNSMDSTSQRALDAMTQELNNQMMASNILSSGAQDPLALAQQAQLMASLNGYVPPAMLSQMFNPFLNQILPHSSHKDKGHRRGNGASSNSASTSREPSNHSESTSTSKQSASPHTTIQNNTMSPEQLYKALTNQHHSNGKKSQNEHAMQAEMVHQLEQQLIMHQLQLQQQQDHIQEAIKHMNKPNSEMSLQQQLTQSLYQQSLMSPSNALNPALNDYMLNSQLMAMGQLPNNFLKDSNFQDARKNSSDSSKQTSTFRNNSSKHDTPSKSPGKASSPKPKLYSPTSKASQFTSYHKENKKEDGRNLSLPYKSRNEATQSKDLTMTKVTKDAGDFSQKNLSNDALFKEMFSNNSLQSNRKMKQTLTTEDRNNLSAFNEKDFFLGIQSMLATQAESLPCADSQKSNQVEKAMKAAYDDIVQNARNCDLNKMNEVLAGIVAAEMQRLQEQQVNLTRELDLLNKPKDKKSMKSEPANRISVIHKASPSEKNQGSSSRFNFEKVSSDLFLPLDRKWKRETKFKCINQSVKAYVVYVSPNGDALRNMEDIMNYLKENNISNLQRRNFSFDYHIPVGSFYEQGDQKWNKLTNDDQIRSIIQMIDNINDPSGQNDKNMQRRKQKLKIKAESLKTSNEENMKKELASLKEAELKMKQRAQEKMARQQERQQRLEQQRLEREAREQQLIEEREMRKQQLIFLKALETKKRALEKDRRREEIKNERIYMREKKMEQRRLALELARQLKMPVEDMCLKDNTPLPELPNLLGKASIREQNSYPKLTGNSTADLLMVMEFVYNFKEVFHLEESSIPTINEVHLGLLNNPHHTEALEKITIVLLHQCLCDPGVPAPGPWLHCATGLKVTDIDVYRENYSEILRLFLWARNGYKTDISLELETIPFLSLTSEQKTSVLAFLVNELVCSRPIYLEIERHLEKLSSLRRDKWIVEGKIRQVRIEHANDESDVSLNSSPLKHKAKIKSENNEEQEDKDDKESVKDDEDSNATDDQKSKKDSVMEKKMKVLTKEHHSFNDRLFVSSKPLRALNLGQDRFKRRYWILSNLGGVYVEGLESGCCHDDEGCEESGTDEEEDEIEEGKTGEEKGSESNPKNSDGESQNATENLAAGDNGETLNSMESEQNLADQNVDNEKRENDENQQSCLTNDGESNCVAGEKETDLSRMPLENITAVECNGIGHEKDDSSPCQNTDSNAVSCSDGVTVTNNNQGLAENAMVVDVTPSSTADNISENSTVNSEISVAMETITDPVKPEINQSSFMEETQGSDHSNFKNITDIDSTNEIPDEPSTKQLLLSGNSSALDFTENGAVDMSQKNGPTDICHSEITLVQQNIALGDNIPEQSSIHDKPESACSKYNGQNNNIAIDFTSKSISKAHHEYTPSENRKAEMNTSESKENAEKEDSVMLAAKAIAAKAVASSAHILFPKSAKDYTPVKSETIDQTNNISKTNLEGKNGQQTNNKNEQKPDAKIDHFETDSNLRQIPNHLKNGFGVLTSEVLQSLGLLPYDFTQDQMTALFKINKEQQHLNSLKRTATEDLSNQAVDLSRPASHSQNPANSKYNSEFVHIAGLDEIKREAQTPVEYSLMDINEVKADYFSVMNKNELAMMEQLNELNQKSVLKEALPIPRAMKRGWWKVNGENTFQNLTETLHSRGAREKHLRSMMSKYGNYCSESIELSANQGIYSASCSRQETSEVKQLSNKEEEDHDHESSNILQSSTETAYRLEMETLSKVKDLANRLVDVGILLKDWIQHHSAQLNRDDLSHIPYIKQGDSKHDCTNPIKHHPCSIMSVAVDLLGSLEFCIPRNYLKPPLIRKGGASEFSNLPSLSESGASDVAAGLRSWRNAVATVTSVSQLSMCVAMLNTSIAWERSPVTFGAKSKKRKCDKRTALKSQSGDTKKRKTKSSDNITGEKTNSNKRNLVNGDSNLENKNNHNKELLQTAKNSLDQSGEENQNNLPFTNSDREKKKKKKNPQVKPKAKKSPTARCKTILKELQAHENATWFLFPVDTKVIPEYRKIIKKPIDFNTIQNRLKKGRYKDPEIFATDMRLVFDNCKLYNTDDSPIGQAGHALRSVFEKRWNEVETEMFDTQT